MVSLYFRIPSAPHRLFLILILKELSGHARMPSNPCSKPAWDSLTKRNPPSRLELAHTNTAEGDNAERCLRGP